MAAHPKLNERQQAIEWLALPNETKIKLGLPTRQDEWEKKLHLGHGKITKWKRDPAFLDEVLKRLRENARLTHTPEIAFQTAEWAKKGNQQAVTNYFKYIEQIAEISQVNTKNVSDILDDDRETPNREAPAD